MYYEAVRQLIQSLKNAGEWLDTAKHYAASKELKVQVILDGRLAPGLLLDGGRA